MSELEEFSLKVKIVTLRVRKINASSQYSVQLKIGNRFLDKKFINFNSGLLQEHITLGSQITNDHTSDLISLALLETNEWGTSIIGNIQLSINVIKKIGLQTFNILQRKRPVAYCQAFILLLPTIINSAAIINPTSISSKTSHTVIASPLAHVQRQQYGHTEQMRHICRGEMEKDKCNLKFPYEQKQEFLSIGVQTFGFDEFATLNKMLQEECLRLQSQKAQLLQQMTIFSQQKQQLACKISELQQYVFSYQQTDFQKVELINQLYDQIKLLKLQKYELLLQLQETNKLKKFRRQKDQGMILRQQLNHFKEVSKFPSYLSEQINRSPQNTRKKQVAPYQSSKFDTIIDADLFQQIASIPNSRSNCYSSRQKPHKNISDSPLNIQRVNKTNKKTSHFHTNNIDTAPS